MSAADIPPTASKILRKKSSTSRSVDNGTATSITKRTKIPSTKFLVPVSTMPENRFAYTGKVYEHKDNFADEGEYRVGWNKYEREHPKELNEINAEANREENTANHVAKYAFNRHPERSELNDQMRSNVKNRKKPKKGQKEFDWKKGKNGKRVSFEGANIQDASFKEVTGESSKFRKAPSRDARSLGLAKKSTEPTGIAAISEKKRQLKSQLVKFEPAKPSKIIENNVSESSKRFRKAPSRDARNLGLAKKGKSVEPAGIAAISEKKRQTKSELIKFNPAKPSTKAQNVDTNYLIDKAFDQLVDTGKAVGKVAGKAGKTAGIAAKTGLNATKAGLREFNEISEIVVQNPMLIRMGQAHEATLRGMASHRRHALGSIAAVGANRRQLSAGSLVAQKGFVTRTNTQAVAPYPTQNQVIPKVIHRKGGDQVRYFLPTGQEVSAAVARKLLHGSVSVPTQANNASTTIEHTYSRDIQTKLLKKSLKLPQGS